MNLRNAIIRELGGHFYVVFPNLEFISHLCIHSFAHISIHSFYHSSIHLSIHKFIHSFIYSWIIHSSIYVFIHLLTYRFIHPFMHERSDKFMIYWTCEFIHSFKLYSFDLWYIHAFNNLFIPHTAIEWMNKWIV